MSNRKNRIFIMSKNMVVQKAKNSLEKPKKNSKRKYIFTEVISRMANIKNGNNDNNNPIQPKVEKQPSNHNNLTQPIQPKVKLESDKTQIAKDSTKIEQNKQPTNTKRLNIFLQSIRNKDNQLSANNSKQRLSNNQSKINRRGFTQSGRKRISLFCRHESPNNIDINYSMPKPRRRIFSQNYKIVSPPKDKRQNQAKEQLKSMIKEQQQKNSSRANFSRQNQSQPKHQ